MKIREKEIRAIIERHRNEDMDDVWDFIREYVLNKVSYVYKEADKHLSYPPDWSGLICLRIGIRHLFPLGFHFVSTDCANAKMCLCIYSEDGEIKTRRHRIGNCPDSTYELGEMED